MTGAAFEWPPIDDEVRRAVVEQLARTTSIYDRADVVASFETRFRTLPGLTYALATSSGTAALHSAYYAIGLGPGDEVLAPAYTFFATVAPLFQLGAQPVLVDATVNGLLDLDQARRLVTGRTRAMVICHMWGYPHPVSLYREFCDEFGLVLVEDCSHAHGAIGPDGPVGSLADIAVWSLQANKLVPAGEGGVLCTDNEDLYARANLLGHFNRRARTEVPANHDLFQYWETGTGLKYRAHPLGLAMAEVFLGRLSGWLTAKGGNAERLIAHADRAGGPRVLQRPQAEAVYGYYALPFTVDVPGGVAVEALARHGFPWSATSGSMRSLSTFELFQRPLSPVVRYDLACVRAGMAVAEHLSDTLVRIPVPVAQDRDAADYIDRFGVAVAATTAELQLRTDGVVRAMLAVSVTRALDDAARDGVQELVVGAVIHRYRDGRPEVLIAQRQPDDFMGGFEEILGGAVEDGETVIEALVREIAEESGLTVLRASPVFAEFDYRNSIGRLSRQLNFAVEVAATEALTLSAEHTGARWIRFEDIESSRCSPEVRRVLRRWFTYHRSGLAEARCSVDHP